MNDDALFDARELLEQAEHLVLSGDPTGAVARAREALRVARDPDLRDEIALALNRFHTAERNWLEAAAARRERSQRREQEAA